MKVRLKNAWFAPTDKVHLNAVQSTVGRLYKSGVHPMPDSYRDILPSTAEVLDESYVEPTPEAQPEQTLKDFDHIRQSAEEWNKIMADAQAAELAKAEEAKAEKKSKKD